MAKRFTDSNKWDKASFMALPAPYKLAFIYLCDKCDHAGIWDINIELLNVHTGLKLTLDELLLALRSNIERLSETKLSITGFIEFQYGELKPSNRVHLSVIHILEKIKKNKPLPSPYLGAKDKDKEKDMDMDQEKEKDKEPEKIIKPLDQPVYVPSAPKVKVFNPAAYQTEDWDPEAPRKVHEILENALKNNLTN